MDKRPFRGRTQVQHTGGIEGFSTVLSYYPDSEITVAVLANVVGSQPGAIAANLGGYVHGEELVLTSERVEIEFVQSGAGRLEVEGRNGLEEIRAAGHACAQSQRDLNELRLTLEESDDEIVLTAHYP